MSPLPFLVAASASELDASHCAAPPAGADGAALEEHGLCLVLLHAEHSSIFDAFDAVLRRDPGRESALPYLGRTAPFVEPAKADALLERVRGLDLRTAEALAARAALLTARREWPAARADLDEAVEVDPQNPEWRLARAEVAWCTADLATALADASSAAAGTQDLRRLQACRIAAQTRRATGDEAGARATLAASGCRYGRQAAPPNLSTDALLAELDRRLDETFGAGQGRPRCP